jgi:peptide/nickel transport system permease protein
VTASDSPIPPGAAAGPATVPGTGRLVAPFRHPVVSVVSRRLLLAIPLLFVVSVLSFVLVSATPGDATTQILGVEAPPEAYAKLRSELGLDQPLYEQYSRWVGDALQGDLGSSLFSGEHVTTTIADRLPVTLSLVIASLLVISVVGVGLGVFGAVHGGVTGRIVDGLSLVGFALPGFWVGAVLIALFAVELAWLPAVGYVPLSESPSAWARSLALPVVALALHSVAVLAKQTREAMLDALASEHVRMAWANGIPPRYIHYRLALKNAAPRVVTIIGLQTVGLLVGTVFIEHVFALPGLGSALVSSTNQGDLPVVQGITVFFALIIVVVNLLVDLTYSLLDPRVRTA